MRGLVEIENISRRALQRRLSEQGTPLPVELEDTRDLNTLLQHLGHIPHVVDSRGWLSLDARTEGYPDRDIKVGLEELNLLTVLAHKVKNLVARYGTLGLGMSSHNEDGHTAYIELYLPSPNQQHR